MNTLCLKNLHAQTLLFLNDIISGKPLKIQGEDSFVPSFDQRLKVALALMKLSGVPANEADNKTNPVDIKKLANQLAKAGIIVK